MQGDKQVITHLNELLAGELTAIDQYFIHSRMYENWGLSKLYERIGHEMQDETNHADALIKRILFLEGTPDLSKREPLAVGATVPEMLKNDLAVEYKVVADLRKVIVYCESVRDFQTREILEVMLDDTEEDHAHWLEKQLGLINLIGLENYLQSQI
ncbi:bacterioferritin [Methylomonas montana]|uniref:bacterioferritin n=1 Tax=Methylomonas montana TaxID=3058963 RepID=UPI00265AFBA6|nr:bacterioferritin [Methylomonas montana]WKJ91555.1 bacterioferritin [Methylomonas montana]